VNSLLAEINFNIFGNVILPKCSTLVVLRYICERGGAAIYGEEGKKKKQVDQFGPWSIKQSSVRTSSHRSIRTISSDLHNDFIITLNSQ
jgi:hypothetical protein